MKIGIACDHGGVGLKRALSRFLKDRGFEVTSFGTNSAASVDYPDYAEKLCRAILNGRLERGILICGTGIGMTMTANKFKRIRAALCTDEYMARMSREHNDANVLCLGGRVLGEELAKSIVDVWLKTPFAGGRHSRRLKKMAKIEDSNLS